MIDLGIVDTIDTSKHVLRSALPRQRLIDTLLDQLTTEIPVADRKDHNKWMRYRDRADVINQFGGFLRAHKINKTAINEELLKDFQDHLANTKDKRYAQNKASRLRSIINALPDTIRQRDVLSMREVHHINRFHGLSAETEKYLRMFLKDGRKLAGRSTYNAPILSTKLLSPRNRECTTDRAVRHLRKLNKQDFREVTAVDINKCLYEASNEDVRDTIVSELAAIRPIYAYLIAHKYIKESPLRNIDSKRFRINRDYLPPEQIERLRDLSTVDFDDIWDVRDRLICFGLCYDFAIRNMEARGLKVSDIKINNYVELLMRPENQKGQYKPERMLCNFFPETMTLMTAYLKLRNKRQPNTDSLIISKTGTALAHHGLRDCVVRHCKKFGIVTVIGTTPSPHRFRHTFGTLNIKPLGVGLEPYEIQSRLRHSSLDTTIKIYVTENPLLDRAKHEIKIAQINGTNGYPSAQYPQPSMRINDWMPESDALRDLKALNITSSALRQYTTSNRLNQYKNDIYFYPRTFVSELLDEWTTKHDAMRLMKCRKSAYFHWVQEHGIEQRVIGKVSLVRIKDVLQKRRNRT